MLLLALLAHLLPAGVQQPDRGPSRVNQALGHLGLTIIALVYVLVTFWQG